MSAVLHERPGAAVKSDVAAALALARRLGRAAFVSRVETLPAPTDPLAFLHAGARELGHGVLWDQGDGGVAFAGAGAAAAITAYGETRFSAVAAAIADFASRLVREDEGHAFPLLGGFAFSCRGEKSAAWRPYPDALFRASQALLQITPGAALLRVTARVAPDAAASAVEHSLAATMARARQWAFSALPPRQLPSIIERRAAPARAIWESSVAAAASRIRQGNLDKVVLAREERLLFDREVPPVAALARLREANGSAVRFGLQSGRSWFIGSTPERLVRLDRGRVDVTCLAGSIGVGHGEAERRELAARLLASKKDRREHEIVVRATAAALAELCADVAPAPGSPRVVQARSVQHLETPLTARMPQPGHVLDLVERLHPTPAVGGHPRDQALAALRELEEFDRGWYAGPIGWTDLDGGGEFGVAIRSTLLSGRSAFVYAGCGIVADSEPAAEWEETCWKLRPMLEALGQQ